MVPAIFGISIPKQDLANFHAFFTKCTPRSHYIRPTSRIYALYQSLPPYTSIGDNSVDILCFFYCSFYIVLDKLINDISTMNIIECLSTTIGTTFGQTAASLVTLTISLERCIVICAPFRARTICTKRNALRVILLRLQ